ncbi:arylmalonate decarboxylase [Candidatus Rhodobacter oscarellae]|uniref:arylmalonate decarboxylase n=1 Tax=Candidatus Rhodobacter oscarellae TaxID=1675527 RepID=UPI000A8CF986|nr:aspartate/glutamate racemase family protein [Candidatus Rhodobacter lobularis]
MIVPPAAGEVPPEPLELYPDVNFLATGLAIKDVSPASFEEVLDRIATCAKTLAVQGADVISLMGTSLSFYRGPAYNAQLVEVMKDATGLPCTTMTNAVLDALRHVGGARIAIATAYTDALNIPLVRYLEASGYCVENLESLNLSEVEDVLNVTDAQLNELCLKTAAASPQADAIFLSCGGLHTAAITQPLEDLTGLPLISSAMAGTWGVVRLAELDTRVAGYGQLFET